ncbi:MAG TPA: PIG-L family deacetylase [Terriglobales bacterium]|nr:PIG-L family deacetylase [Terriglobales bacterium]
MKDLAPLLGTSLILVAHPDDEVIGFGGLMQRMSRPIVVFSTDGAPRDRHFWKDYGSRENYAAVRRREAREALSLTGAERVFLADHTPGGIADQELFQRLPDAITTFDQIVAEVRPDALLTLAYEGGHPDHDAACFMAFITGRRTGIPVWEAPLYHRRQDGASATQTFPTYTGQERLYSVRGDALDKKIGMLAAYPSQELVLSAFRPEVEQFRPLADYDFTRPPLPWKLNYEHWQWPMTGEDVASEFRRYLSSYRERKSLLIA